MPFFNNVKDKLERKRFNELWYVCHENEQSSETYIGYFVTIMFGFMWNIQTIYAPTTFNTTNVTNSEYMFYECNEIVGMLGTTFDSNHIDCAYAHIDGGTPNPGYFTDRQGL